jgi:S-DNA-T family DNA segregation ATPase FtsK/SpoIIIE
VVAPPRADDSAAVEEADPDVEELDDEDEAAVDVDDQVDDAEGADAEEDEYDDEDEYEDEDEDEVPTASRDVHPLIVKHFERQAAAPPPEPYPREIEDWTFPPLSLLEDPEYSFSAQQESVVRAKAKVLERTLEEFRLAAQVVEIDTGPVITMYELQLAPGIKVSQIAALANDIARALKAPAVRVVAPIPGKNTVGIEVPNIDKEKVRLKELLAVTGKRAREMSLPIFIGKNASGSPLVGDLAKMPHLLIAGTTGSGKSVCINSIITSLLMTQRPDWCKLILADPKMVELAQFKDVPHLMCPIITDMRRAEQILEWAVTKMEERYELLSEGRVRNIAAYNALGKDLIYERFEPANDEERSKIPTHMPYVVIIVDELADLMMTSAKEVEHHLSRLAQKSRAVGIHIVVATQRPEVKVVTGLIKSNMPCRIAFRVASRMDSRIVLDQNGAEVLMGQGDMLFLPPGSAKLIRAQGTFLEDRELHAIISFLTDRAQPEFHPELIRLDSAGNGDLSQRDPLFDDADDAVRIVLESRRGSVSLLQRRLTIGYSRASRLIEQMADAGIVGIYKGSQAREVLMTVEEWEALREQLAAEVAEGYAADQDDDDAGVPDLTDDHDIHG